MNNRIDKIYKQQSNKHLNTNPSIDDFGDKIRKVSKYKINKYFWRKKKR